MMGVSGLIHLLSLGDEIILGQHCWAHYTVSFSILPADSQMWFWSSMHKENGE